MKFQPLSLIAIMATLFCLGTTQAFAAGQIYTSDVIIIGGGGAGMAAAVSAAPIWCPGYCPGKITDDWWVTPSFPVVPSNAPDPERQKKLGIEDSADLFL